MTICPNCPVCNKKPISSNSTHGFEANCIGDENHEFYLAYPDWWFIVTINNVEYEFGHLASYQDHCYLSTYLNDKSKPTQITLPIIDIKESYQYLQRYIKLLSFS